MLPVTRPAFKLVPPAAAPKPPTTDSHVLESHIGDGCAGSRSGERAAHMLSLSRERTLPFRSLLLRARCTGM
jgi:hypothetical protein